MSFINEFGRPELIAVVALSLRVTGAALLVATLLGVPIGAMLGLVRFRGRQFITVCLYTGMGLPPVVVGLFVYMLLSRSGPLGTFGWLFSPAAMIVAQTVIAFPLVAGLTMSAVGGVESAVRLQAVALGASPWQVAWTVLHEARVGVTAAIVAAFGGIISEVGAVMLRGRQHRGADARADDRHRALHAARRLRDGNGARDHADCGHVRGQRSSDASARADHPSRAGLRWSNESCTASTVFAIDTARGPCSTSITSTSSKGRRSPYLARAGQARARCFASCSSSNSPPKGDWSSTVGWYPRGLRWPIAVASRPCFNVPWCSTAVCEPTWRMAFASAASHMGPTGRARLSTRWASRTSNTPRARTLSGGEIQRVALGRAMAFEPSVLLLDEPTANLDPHNVRLVENLICQRQTAGTTIVLATHQIFQARRLASRAALLLDGRIVESGTTSELLEHPKDPRTRAFLSGEMVY